MLTTLSFSSFGPSAKFNIKSFVGHFSGEFEKKNLRRKKNTEKDIK